MKIGINKYLPGFLLSLLFALVVVFNGYGQITQAEYFWDTDPGEGNGTAITALDGNLDQAVETLFKNGVNIPSSTGNHTFGIRVRDANGWGQVFYTVVNISGASNSFNFNVVQAEYFWDTDPGEGSGTAILALDGNLDQAIETLFKNNVTVPAAGNHKFGIRVKNPDNWGQVFYTTVNISAPSNSLNFNVVQAEYFWDTDPGEGSGTAILALDGNLDQAIETLFKNNVAVPAAGNHKFGIRVKNPDNWGQVFYTIVNISDASNSFNFNVVQAEYFWDTDPGEGNGTAILALDGNLNQAVETLFSNGISYPSVVGMHTFNIRVNSTNGWGAPLISVVEVETGPNVAPVITGVVSALSTPEEAALTITLTNLTVTDLDNTYPTDFTLTVQSGTNYSVSGNTITPATNFTGNLTVPVVVNDGTNNSVPFNLTVMVTPQNDKPIITGVVSALNTPEETALTINLANLTVTDPDNNYPADFTLTVQSGTNYSVSGNTITPATNFTGNLTVPVVVNDGSVNSDVFNLTVTVTPQNDKPVITGVVSALSTPEETAFTITLANLTVTDPDNNYPADFSLTVQSGTNYSVSGNTITPTTNFTGNLTVPVVVNDGSVNSDAFNLTVTVTPQNDKPVITGVVSALNTPEETALTITLANLTVTDPDNNYPADFTLTVQSGTNYSVSGNTITPATNFTGNLTVPVVVNDGSVNSNAFNLTVTVTPQNDKPVITGVVSALSTPEETALTITLGNLTVTDPDNNYPADFTLTVQSGANYSVSGNTITPITNFTGNLTVPVVVNDGSVNSDAFNLTVTVTPQNDKPVITGVVSALSTQEGTALTLNLTDLTVTDPDNNYPADFTLTVQTGSNYSVSGNTITPAANFTGNLTVPVVVNDGSINSDVYNLTVTVTPQNDKPVITGVVSALSTPEETALTITLANLTVTDPDNTYPADFTLTVQSGSNYSVSGNTITPATNFTGNLTVPVVVNDGSINSDAYNLTVTVTPQNDKPVINGVVNALSTPEETALNIILANLTVTDPDNSYPADFTLTVQSGANYSVNGNTITPNLNFVGDLTVPITVNDGMVSSDIFNLTITVTPVNDKPIITGTVNALSTPQETALTLNLSDLTVTDPDNNYPVDFTLNVQPGNNYSVNGNAITPNLNFTGTLTVPVTVNDGNIDSDVFNLTITVTPASSEKPVITGVVSPLVTPEEVAITLKLSDFLIGGVSYTTGYDLSLQTGSNYTLTGGNIITPAKDFNGTLTVPVTVSKDGVESDLYELSIQVTPVNDAPEITGASRKFFAPKQGQFTIQLSDLIVEDPDNNYPDDFSLVVLNGQGYNNEDGKLTITETEKSQINVSVRVNDGSLNSNIFNVAVEIRAESINVYPNPASDFVKINFSSGNTSPVKIRLLSLKGEKIREFSLDNNSGILEHTISLKELSSGVYILQVEQGAYKTFERIVKY